MKVINQTWEQWAIKNPGLDIEKRNDAFFGGDDPMIIMRKDTHSITKTVPDDEWSRLTPLTLVNILDGLKDEFIERIDEVDGK